MESDVLSFFCRHVVCLNCTTTARGDAGVRYGKSHRMLFCTGFIASVGDRWWLLTAGHIASDLNSILKDGHKLESVQLLDSFGWTSHSTMPIPFAYDPERVLFCNIDEGVDFAFIPLSKNTVALLRANGIEPTPLDNHVPSPDELQFFFMLGLPSSGNALSSNSNVAQVSPCLANIRYVPVPPDEVRNAHPLFHFEVTPKAGDIDGFSGGPIIGARMEGGRIRYWVIGLQSGWYPARRLAVATPIAVIQHYLNQLVERVRDGELETLQQQ